MLGFVVICSLVAVTFAQFGPIDPHHGHHSSQPHESSELGTVTFYYDPQPHYMVARTSTYCYLMSLNADQQRDVHTIRGMEDLEVNMLAMISGGEDTVIFQDLLAHDHNLDNLCKYHKLYKVGTVNLKTTTTTMPMP